MLLFGLISSPLQFSIYIFALLVAITIHEAAHAYMAHLLGDNTARLMGRLTLNPLAHLDLWGSIMLLLAGFGWGKPVLVNPRNFSNPKLDNFTVSLAGPMSNFLLAAILGLMMRFITLPDIVQVIFSIIIFFNLTLMIFNLLPIPPLDGSKVLALFLPNSTYIYLQQIGFYILLLLIIFSNQIPVISFVLTRVVGFFFVFLTGQPVAL